MHRFLLLASLALSALVALPNVGHAEQLMKLPPEMLLVRGTTDQGEASYNANAGRITADKLPEAVLNQVKARVISYVGDAKQLDNVTVYVWSAPYFQDNKLPPNYIIDYSTLQASSKDAPNPACDETGCELVGFTYVNKSFWKQDFETSSFRTSFDRSPDPQGSGNYSLLIETLSNKEDCTVDGRQTKEGCVRRFTWRKFGLAVLPPETR